MRWHELLFMHWPVPAAALRPLLPPSLGVETFDGTAWIGVVPFRMSGVRPRLTPPLPGLQTFPELNVRTYVTHRGQPGVWFFSLDAAHPLAVEAARATFHLNYRIARMRCDRAGDQIRYASVRTAPGAPPATFAAHYRPNGPVFQAKSGTLDSFLTERTYLYAANRRGELWRGAVHHAPWPLQRAEAEIVENRMTEQIGLRLPDTPPLLHYAHALPVVAWWPERINSASRAHQRARAVDSQQASCRTLIVRLDSHREMHRCDELPI
jgi:hypothetical protein